MNARAKPTTLAAIWPALLIGSIWLWMFWPMISGQTVCGFRDSAYLYYPLFKWIDSVWASGQIPLWNPYDNYGMPVVGDGSSSVFYPGKLIFLLRFLSYPSRYGIYLSSHVLLAAIGAYQFGRTLKANRAGSTLAAISYALGGSVLFQVTNVIYLVSAAWLPFALIGVWRMTIRSDWRWAVATGVVCALMILGGDPQMVYHVGLIAVASGISNFWRRRRRLLRTNARSTSSAYRWALGSVCRIMLLVTVTSGLAAIQILPTAHWAARSERVVENNFTNIYQTGVTAKTVPDVDAMTSATWRHANDHSHSESTSEEALFGTPEPGTPKDATYQFSQAPWTMAELLFPNVSGKPFPTHQRWSDALRGADRMWTPSIYAGVLTALLGLATFRLWGKNRRAVWLTRIGLFFALASLGWFGAVWALNELLLSMGCSVLSLKNGASVGPQVGGPYWLMVTFLPKYFMFRYPAKLFVIASLMLSVLAGLGVSRRPALSWKLSVPMIVFCLAGLVGLAGLSVSTGWGQVFASKIQANLLFGPFDTEGALTQLRWSFFHSIGFATTALSMWLVRARLGGESRSFFGLVFVLLVASDLAIANRWLLAEVPANVFEHPLPIGKQLSALKEQSQQNPVRIYRNFDMQMRYQTWQHQDSKDRLAEIITWQRETLFPKHQLEHSVALLGSFGSVWPRSYANTTRSLDSDSHDEGFILEGGLQAYVASAQMAWDRRNDTLVLMPEPNEYQCQNTRLVNRSDNRSWSCFAVPEQISTQLADSEPSSSPQTLVRQTSLRSLDIELQIQEPMTLLVSTLYDAGWSANVTETNRNVTESAPLESVMDLWMSIDLQPGNYHVALTYSPIEFWIGCWVSGLSWCGLLIGAYWVRRQTAVAVASSRS